MIEKLKKFIKLSVIKYMIYSCFTMGIELVLGLLMLELLHFDAVIANTVSIVIGAMIHYYLISKGVFESAINTKNTFAYIITFFVGMVLQNVVLDICYSVIFVKLVESIRYVISKGVSVVVPFAVTYMLRKFLLKKRG